ncbi:glycosyltransferase [Baekduia soli]|uniref:Glycosyltransferase n=1 Tax=Baekduia soli TaxID=496014 RepID=A0A5B8U4N5_9ACTN|nr:glycosyltransferase [Baekduia soli]QEC47818.1 glycosyltransferase [Baekduia soli]
MSPETLDHGHLTLRRGGAGRARLRLVPAAPLRIVDVVPDDGPGALRTYLDAKSRLAAHTGELHHDVLVRGRSRSRTALAARLRALAPDVVLLHDPWPAPLDLVACARGLGARTVAVHHGSSEAQAAVLPGPSRAHLPAVRAQRRRLAREVDAVMGLPATTADSRRVATLAVAMGVDDAFRPRADVRRGDHVLYVGRLARGHGLFRLLDAAARSADPWPLHLVGAGPLEDALRTRAQHLGLGRRVSVAPDVRDRECLARRMAAARCVVVPGALEPFGLVALEAAACGTPVAGCLTAPALGLVGGLGHRFAPGDPTGLDRAIAAARAAGPDAEAGAVLAWRHAWDRVLREELRRLRELAC